MAEETTCLDQVGSLFVQVFSGSSALGRGWTWITICFGNKTQYFHQ